tara:strand:- start:6914 stop:7234 length:321 start_codon:yes stop_codon:yes gene_type:complete
MKKTGKLNILVTTTTNSTAVGYERCPIEEVVLEKESGGYKRGSGTLDNTINNGTLIIGQNLEVDGVIQREDKKLYGSSTIGMTGVSERRNINIITGMVNSSKYANG